MNDASGFQIANNAPAAYDTQVACFMEPFVDALVAASVRPGDAVLDVACGTGFATRAAATAAGPDSRVEGADINPSMLAHARASADPSTTHLRWVEASALDLPYAPGEFDAVICQQGLQFFPDPVAGVREFARVTRPGGAIGATVWSASADTPFLHFETEMLARHGGGVQAEFSASESELNAWFDSAGVRVLDIERLEVDVDLPPVAEYVPRHLEALPWSAAFFQLPEEDQIAAIAELEHELSDYETANGIRVPFSSYLITARRD